MQLGFGAGVVWGTPLVDVNGNAITNGTPVQLGILQEVQLDIEFSVKELYGANQFPVAIGRGQGKISGNAKTAQINGLTWASLFFGQATTTGLLGKVADTTGSVIPGTPFTVTPTVPGSGAWASDLGVKNAAGNPMVKVASGTTPTTGQYSVAAGVYTFAAADTTTTVFISYGYTSAIATANKQTVLNNLMGYTPAFSMDLLMQYQGQQLTFHLYQAVSSKLSIDTKLDDFLIPEFDFSCFADSQGRVMDWSSNQ